MSKIYVVGSINRDLVAFVERLPKPGETIFGTGFQQFPGGKGANQAVAASRLGGKVYLVGNVGTDSFGEEMLRFLSGENIDVSDVVTLKQVPTGIALISVDARSENSIIVISGANMVWNSRDLNHINIEQGDILLSQFEIPLEIIDAMFAQAKSKGATTILNPAPIKVPSDKLLKNVDYMVVNEVELEALTNLKVHVENLTSVSEAAEKLREQGPRAVIATLGSRGAILFASQKRYEAKGHKVKAVDTTGAGDCFIGGFAAALGRAEALPEALKFANRAAAISVMRTGAASSIPTAAEVREAEFL